MKKERSCHASCTLLIFLTRFQKFTGGPFGITTKIPKSSFTVTAGKDSVKVHEADNGAGVVLHREFCNECGSGLLEFGVSINPAPRIGLHG